MQFIIYQTEGNMLPDGIVIMGEAGWGYETSPPRLYVEPDDDHMFGAGKIVEMGQSTDCVGPILFFTEHRHDGTQLFTVAAICALTQHVKETMMDPNPGKYRCSHVHLFHKFNDSVRPTSMHEMLLMCVEEIA